MLIQMTNIGRAYRKGAIDIFALQQVDLSIAEGEFVTIMGPSGSGKSTLLLILGCLDRPSHGCYSLDGINVSELDDAQLSRIRNQKIGFVFQSFNLFPQYTSLQNIESPLLYSPKLFGKGNRSFSNSINLFTSTEKEKKVRAQKLAERVGLGERLHHRPSELSGGEMQRVAIARALVTQPRVILADEPTGNLDSTTGQEIMVILRDLHEQGHTVIMVTHEHSIAAYAERIIYLKDGKIERQEAPGSAALRGGAVDTDQDGQIEQEEAESQQFLEEDLDIDAGEAAKGVLAIFFQAMFNWKDGIFFLFAIATAYKVAAADD